MPDPEEEEAVEVTPVPTEAETIPAPITKALMVLANRQEALNNDLIQLGKRLDQFQTPDPSGPKETPGDIEEVAQEETEPDPKPGKPTEKRRRVRLGKRRS